MLDVRSVPYLHVPAALLFLDEPKLTNSLFMTQYTLPGLGEPLNVIISGLSDPYVLTLRGLLHYSQSLGFSTSCFGIQLGNVHVANLGDSISMDVSHLSHLSHSHAPMNDSPMNEPSKKDISMNYIDIPDAPVGGNKTEQLLARQNFDWPLHGWPDYGTCWESLVGGNHFRAWKQDGGGARTNAWFLA
jgi:hypothetical protein